jgi:Reverse transcriptase (RNA-dependent DNA polymerase)
MKNETWSLVHLPPGRTAVKSRWVSKVKPGIDGSATRHKARLVAKGYTQRPGIDYADTYSPVVKHDSLRTVLSISAAQDLEMLQLDIKTAFLYGDLEEEIYLEQPEGFVATGQEEKVCKLRKCIYGLKQASRVWNRTFDDFLLRFGLSRSATDPCIYIHRHEETFVIVAIWVDDGLVCANNNEIISNVYAHLNTHFDMRSAPATNFVGLEILRDRSHRKLHVSQQRYITKILHKFDMFECNAKKFPADPNARLTMNKDHSTQILEDAPYREAIGSLMYLMLASRPDIAYAVNQVAQFCERPEAPHWAAVKRIFAYFLPWWAL